MSIFTSFAEIERLTDDDIRKAIDAQLAGGHTMATLTFLRDELVRREQARSMKRLTGTVGDLMDTTDSGLDGNFRITKDLLAAVMQLHETTKTTADANERTAKRLVRLTWALVVFTVVIAVFTGVLLVRPGP